jgi:hypothetical protein
MKLKRDESEKLELKPIFRQRIKTENKKQKYFWDII